MYSLVNLWELSQYTLFDDIKLPEGIDKEILINTIFDECAEYEPLTINVDLMKAKIKNFFLRNYDNFSRLYAYTQLEYNPIENYNKYSDITTTDSKKDTTSNNRNISTTNNRTLSNSSEDETKISAYDSTTYQNNQLVNSTNGGTDNTTGSETDNDSGTLESNGTNVVSDHTHGNIGVTTTTQMLEQDTKYWTLNNMYTTIAQKFMFTLTITTL